VAVLVVTLAATLLQPAGAVPDGDPPLTVPPAALAEALACRAPSPGHGVHRPVLLVHGTGLTPDQSWAWNYEAALPPLGYPTCTVALPQAALGDIQVASEFVVYSVDSMVARWRSSVDIIGHSQGGIEPRWALRWWPRMRHMVAHYIGLASPNHGIDAADVCADSGNCWPAVWQMAQGSRLLTALNRGSEAPGPTSYTNVYSETDDLVQPALIDPTAALAGSPNVANISVQSVCPGRYVNHGGMLADAVVFAIVMDALRSAGPAGASRIPASVCAQTFMPHAQAPAAIIGNAEVYTSAAKAFGAHPGSRQEPPLAPYAR
jgi:triacylglycerol esterase/lipase EstA (alpha/beta hydrolase family)